jgi:2-C-methyl-D-erythritol 4-phosphate cytidylyltransferase/2-C-methyl-D-erythritol 2,4-cyclodiphosphate synthase
MNVTALIVAAGSGTRMGGGLPKQYRTIGGKAVLAHAVEAMIRHPRINEVRVVIGEGQDVLAAQALEGLEVGPLIIGGATRQQSVMAGLRLIKGSVVLIHDAARPFCPPAVVDRLLDALEDHDGAVPVLPVADTLSRADYLLGEPVDRQGLVRIQTPQAFGTQEIWMAHGENEGEDATDDASLFRRLRGTTVAAVEGDPSLEKLTTEVDFALAEARLEARMTPRTGLGFDVHAFAADGPVMLGGIAIAHERGLAGHSDADVVLHAITDALLGAAGLGDIGQHFPPSDQRWKGAASDVFLVHAADLIRANGGVIDHVDCTVICEEPKVGPHRAAMRASVARILGLPEGAVSIKATTTEGLGFTGRREGIAAQAVASIRMETKR